MPGVEDNMAGHGESASETELRWVEDLIQPGGSDPLDLVSFKGASPIDSAIPKMLEALKAEAALGEASPEAAQAVERIEAGVDLMREAAGMFAGDLWTPSGRQPNEWGSVRGARVRLSWARGEVCATFLPAGWEGMATYQRALVSERVRVRATEDLVELGFASVEYGGLGGRAQPERPSDGGGTSELAGAGAPLGAGVAGSVPEPGSTELRVMPMPVALMHDREDGSFMESGMLPTRAHGSDAGLDLYTVGEHSIGAGEWYDLPCGIAVEIPEHCWGMIIGRSSAMKRRGLHVQISVIDPGYRGPIYVQAMNVKPRKARDGTVLLEQEMVVRVADKERIGQLILVPNVTPMFQPVWSETLGESERGSSGFGDSGR